MESLNIKNNFQFKGFIPTKKTIEKSKFFYNLVKNDRPATLKNWRYYKKKGIFIWARLKLSSASNCSFDISSKDNNASGSINSLQKQFLNKILKWNQNRQSLEISLNS